MSLGYRKQQQLLLQQPRARQMSLSWTLGRHSFGMNSAKSNASKDHFGVSSNGDLSLVSTSGCACNSRAVVLSPCRSITGDSQTLGGKLDVRIDHWSIPTVIWVNLENTVSY